MRKKARSFDIFCDCTGIGIDVSKASLDMVGIAGSEEWGMSLANDPGEIESLAQTLREGGYRGKIICESTGHYHLLMGLILGEHELDLRIINPLQSSKHQKSRVRKTKTDRMDAYVLATMCETERDLPKAANLQRGQVLIRLKQGQLHALDKQLQRLQRSVNAYSETYAQLALCVGESHLALQQAVLGLKGVKRRLQKELEGLLAEQTRGQPESERLSALPGFSPLVTGLVSTVFDRQAKSHRSWAAYAGLDVSVRQSGAWRGRGKLTKRGNSYLRKRLYCAAWGAVMNYAEVRACYDGLKAAGRNHVEALCIIARKLLRIAYAVLVKGKTYDPAIAFAQ
ncbi:MAG: IS110 family transposase [Pseudomonadales bacterium]